MPPTRPTFPSRVWSRVRGPHAAIPALLLLVAACSDATGPGDEPAFSPGVYAAQADGSQTFGELTFETTGPDGEVIDWVARGASIVITLHEDGTTSGRLHIPDIPPEYRDANDPPDIDDDLTGTWRLEGDTVHFEHEADTFLRDMPFEVQGNDLVGDRTFGLRIRVRLVRRDD